MTAGFGMPGGSEWIVIIMILCLVFAVPILAIILYVKNRALKKQVHILTEERNILPAKLSRR